MPTYAPVSSTVVYTPAVLATLNDLMNETLIPEGYVRCLNYGIFFGPPREPGLQGRPAVPIPSFRLPKKHTGEGTQAEMILNFESTGNIQSFYDLAPLNTAINQGGTKIFTPWAHYSTYAAIGRTQKVENSGAGKQYDILKSTLEQETRAATRRIETDILSTNTDINHNTGQDSLVGLRHWNSDSPSTGTLFGLNRATYTPYRNNTATISSFAATGIDQMQAMWYTTSGTNGNQPVDMIETTPTIHGYIAKQLQSIHRIVGGSANGGDLGVKTIPFNDIPILHSPDFPSGRMDWINTADLHTFILQGCNWATETPGKPNDRAIGFEERWYWTAALMHARPETNATMAVSGA